VLDGEGGGGCSCTYGVWRATCVRGGMVWVYGLGILFSWDMIFRIFDSDSYYCSKNISEKYDIKY
jgi:hypothetical protein